MPPNSKFLTEPAGEKIVKIGQYLVKICQNYNSLLFWPTLYIQMHIFYSWQLWSATSVINHLKELQPNAVVKRYLYVSPERNTQENKPNISINQ